MCKAYRPCTPTGASFPTAPTSASSQPPSLRPVGSPDAVPSFLGKRLLLSFNPLSGTVRAFSDSRHLLRTLQTSAVRSARLSPRPVGVGQLTSATARQISQGTTRYLPCIDAGFTKCTPTADGGLRGHVPLAPDASRLISGFSRRAGPRCSSPRSFGLDFLQTPPRDDALALLLAFGSAKTWP